MFALNLFKRLIWTMGILLILFGFSATIYYWFEWMVLFLELINREISNLSHSAGGVPWSH